MLSPTIDAFPPGTRSFAELVPYSTMLRDDTVLLKDGSLLRAYTLTPVELDDLEAHRRVKVDQSLQFAIRKLTPQFAVWTRQRKRANVRGLTSTFAEVAAQHIDMHYHAQFTKETSFEIERHVILVMTPISGWAGFVERMTKSIRQGSPFLRAFWTSFRDGLSLDRMLARVAAHEAELLDEMDSVASGFVSNAASIELNCVTGDALRGFLTSCTSPTYSGANIKAPDRWQYLDGYLCADQMVAQRNHLEFSGVSGTRFVGIIALKEWPEDTPAGVLNGLMSLPVNFTLSQAFVVSSKGAAKSYIRSMQLFYLNTRKDLRQAVTEYLTKSASEIRDEAKEEAATDSQAAMGALGRRGHIFGYHTLHILVEGASIDELEVGMQLVAEELEAHSFLTLRERVGRVTAFAGTIPGALTKLVRAGFVTNGNVSAMLPAYGPTVGAKTDVYFSEQMERTVPVLTKFQTPYNVPYHFDMHRASTAAHTLLVGPTRTGKTVLALLLASQFERYQGNFIGLDMDRSMKIFACAHNIPYTDPTDGQVYINALGLLEHGVVHLDFLTSWVIGLIESRGSQIDSVGVTQINDGLKNLCSLGSANYRLSALASQLPSNLRERLQPWIEPTGYGRYFDSAQDSFSISGRTAIELGDILQNEVVAGPMLQYIFYRIGLLATESAKTRKPTMIFIPEVWYALKNQKFNEFITRWLKTMAKKMCHVVMDTQSISDVASGDAFASFRSCVPVIFFTPDSRAAADAKFYKVNFGLTELQVDLIARGLPKRNYVLLEGSSARVIDVLLPPNALAFLRSDPAALGALDLAHREYPTTRDDAWRRRYLEIINH